MYPCTRSFCTAPSIAKRCAQFCVPLVKLLVEATKRQTNAPAGSSHMQLLEDCAHTLCSILSTSPSSMPDIPHMTAALTRAAVCLLKDVTTTGAHSTSTTDLTRSCLHFAMALVPVAGTAGGIGIDLADVERLCFLLAESQPPLKYSLLHTLHTVVTCDHQLTHVMEQSPARWFV